MFTGKDSPMRLAPIPWMPALAGPIPPRRHVGAITPTQLRGLGAALRRLVDRLRDRLRAKTLA
jgi:hypothetical protein